MNVTIIMRRSPLPPVIVTRIDRAKGQEALRQGLSLVTIFCVSPSFRFFLCFFFFFLIVILVMLQVKITGHFFFITEMRIRCRKLMVWNLTEKGS